MADKCAKCLCSGHSRLQCRVGPWADACVKCGLPSGINQDSLHSWSPDGQDRFGPECASPLADKVLPLVLYRYLHARHQWTTEPRESKALRTSSDIFKWLFEQRDSVSNLCRVFCQLYRELPERPSKRPAPPEPLPQQQLDLGKLSLLVRYCLPCLAVTHEWIPLDQEHVCAVKVCKRRCRRTN